MAGTQLVEATEVGRKVDLEIQSQLRTRIFAVVLSHVNSPMLKLSALLTASLDFLRVNPSLFSSCNFQLQTDF